MKSLSTAEIFTNRSKQVNYERIGELYYIGSYKRRLGVSITRMIENAYDWEHLPYVHSSSFRDITLIEAGDWGWRAEVSTAKSNGADKNTLELLVDVNNAYWATTVVTGYGEGVEIHTQASELSEQEIEIEVKFFSPNKIHWFRKALSLFYLRNQYRGLYQEDEILMQGRQSAIDDLRDLKKKTLNKGELVALGMEKELRKASTHTIKTRNGEFCITYFEDKWVAYSATCPHQLGSLAKTEADSTGVVTCPWHGYRFDISNGQNLDGKCAKLARPPKVIDQNGNLYLSWQDF